MPGRIVLTKPNKYRNVATVIDGVRFASKKEGRRWCELRALEAAGKIADLKRQTRFPLMVNGVKIGTYVCDFDYVEDGERIIEDVKGGRATRTAVYKIKKLLMLALYGIAIRET